MESTRPKRRTAPALLALIVAAGCAHAPKIAPVDDQRVELERVQAILAEREQTIEQLRNKLALLEAGRRDLAEQLAQREAELEEAERGPARPSEPSPREAELARAAARRENEPRPVLRLHGEQMESTDTRELTSSWQPPTTRERLSVAPLPTLAAASARLPAVSAPAPLAAADSDEAETLYVQALELVRRREFPAALRELDAFVRTFPRDVRTVRALFWRGEVLFAQREYARALVAYEEVLEREPSGDRAADALLRVARCQLRLGAAQRARATVSELRDRFPQSEAARAALRLEQEDT